MSHKKIVIQPMAEIDLEKIYLYSYKEFGELRAIQYLTDIESTFSKLAHNPSLGKNYRDVKVGLFDLAVVSHIVFIVNLNKR